MWISLTSSPISVPNIESQRWDVSFNFDRSREKMLIHKIQNSLELHLPFFIVLGTIAFIVLKEHVSIECIDAKI